MTVWAGRQLWERLDTDTIAPGGPKETDREPSPARSGH
jgi:hypothetical protein